MEALAESPGWGASAAVDVRAGGVTVRYQHCRDYFGMTERAVEVAGSLRGGSRDGLSPTVGLSTARHPRRAGIAALRPFWRAVLGYEPRPDSPTRTWSPARRGPAFWLESMDEPRPSGSARFTWPPGPARPGPARVEAASPPAAGWSVRLRAVVVDPGDAAETRRTSPPSPAATDGRLFPSAARTSSSIRSCPSSASPPSPARDAQVRIVDESVELDRHDLPGQPESVLEPPQGPGSPPSAVSASQSRSTRPGPRHS